MKGNIFTDLATAARATKQVRAARKAGNDGVTVALVKPLPVIHCAGFYSTMEGCVIAGACSSDGVRAAQKAFNALPDEVRHTYCFAPHNGEYVNRARFFSDLLRPVLSPDDFHKAMIALESWYRHIKGTREAAYEQ